MIRQALVALGPKSVAAGVLVGGAALALGALFLPRAVASTPEMYRLVLHAPEESRAHFYVSAWSEGDVFVANADAKSMTFVRRSDEHDGCAWQGTEKLTRLSTGVYAYDYKETILSCHPDANPFEKTPRSGIVTVERWNGPATPTAMNAIQAPGDLWNPTAMNDRDCDDDSVDVDVDVEDTEQAMADAQRELADAQQEIADAIAQANEEVRAALDTDDDE
jgi:hypothetical protein